MGFLEPATSTRSGVAAPFLHRCPAAESVKMVQQPSDDVQLSRLLAAIRSSWGMIAVAVLISTALGVAYILAKRPVYASEATVRIIDERPSVELPFGMAQAGMGSLANLGSRANIQTDMGLLASRQVAESVVDSLALHVSVPTRGVRREEVIRVVDAPRTTSTGNYDLTRGEDGSYRIAPDARTRRPGDAEVAVPGQPFTINEVTLVLRPEGVEEIPKRLKIRVATYQEAVREVRSRLNVVRASGGSNLLMVQYQDSDPELAAAVPNLVTEGFIAFKNRTSQAETQSTIGFLEEQIVSYEVQLREAESALQTYRQQAMIAEPRTQATEQVRQLAELQARRDGLHSEREALRRVIGRITATDPTTGPSPYRQLASYPSFLSNDAVQDVLRSLMDLENRRSTLLSFRTEENLDVRTINSRIAELEQQLFQTATHYLNGLGEQIASLDAVLMRNVGEIGEIPAREVQFQRLARDQKMVEEVYLMIQAKLKEAQIRQASEMSDVQLVDSALVPRRPVAPRPTIVLILSMALGLMAGVTGAIGRRALDTRVHSPEEAVAATEGLTVLGRIPLLLGDAAQSNGRALGGRFGKRLLPTGTRNGPGTSRLVTLADPRAPAAEAYRALRANLLSGAREEWPRVVLFTSALEGDGKSTTCANVAIILAQQGLRVLLVDADLRSPSQHQLLNGPSAPGITDVVLGDAVLDESVVDIPVDSRLGTLHLLPAGSEARHPAETLASPQFSEAMTELRSRFDIVLVDTPPLGLIADAATVATCSDAAVLVARIGLTDRRALHEVAHQLRQLRVRVEGVVLNDDRTRNDAALYGSSYFASR